MIVGFNEHTLSISEADKVAHNTFIRLHNPSSVLVLNDAERATQLANLGVPHVVLRIRFTSDENIQHLYRDPQEWWDSVKPYYADKRLIVHIGNELNGDYNKINSFLLGAARLVTSSGRRCVVGNFAVGNPEPSHWRNELRGLLVALSGELKGKAFLGIHEYMMYYPENGEGYILGRYKDIFAAGYNPDILITEFGADKIDALRPRPDTKGWRTQFPNSTEAHMAYTQAMKYYNHPSVKGIVIFSYGDSGGWDTYDIRNTIFVDKPIQFGANVAEKTINSNVQIRSKMPTALTRIRTAPMDGEIIGHVPEKFTIVYYHTERSNGWGLFTIAGKVGWVSLANIDIQDIPTMPPVTPAKEVFVFPSIEFNPTALTPNERTFLKQVTTTLADGFSQLSTKL